MDNSDVVRVQNPENAQEKRQRELQREKLEGQLKELRKEISLKKREIQRLESRKRMFKEKNSLRNSWQQIVALNVKITCMKTDIEMLKKKRKQMLTQMECQCDFQITLE